MTFKYAPHAGRTGAWFNRQGSGRNRRHHLVGHVAHGQVADVIVDRVIKRIWQGMGFVALHSSHYSKIFKRLMAQAVR